MFDFLQLKLEVMFGIESVEVSFICEGNCLVGVVFVIDWFGFWVLWVEVKDQFGVLFGCDFLEIVEGFVVLIPSKIYGAKVVSK